jgi:hypothetical protein
MQYAAQRHRRIVIAKREGGSGLNGIGRRLLDAQMETIMELTARVVCRSSFCSYLWLPQFSLAWDPHTCT